MLIAVDGPAASGKSTTFCLVAQRLGYNFLDTGLLYRACCFSCLKHGVDVTDETKVITKILKRHWSFQCLPEDGSILVRMEGDEEDHLTEDDLHSHKIDANVSQLAKNPSVREYLRKLQRDIATTLDPCIVLGRDIGTVVLPDAPIKIYLDSSCESRARRRYEQLSKTSEVKYEDVLENLRERDYQDMTRPVAPLVRQPEALYVNNSELTLEETVCQVVQRITDALPKDST